MERMRLNRYIAQSGYCSRRDADKLIDSGRVTVDGEPASQGMQIDDSNVVCIDGKVIRQRDERVVLAFNKPAGVVCSAKDRHAEKLVSDMVKYPIRLTYAGRLDKNSEGLLLLTNDGDLIEYLMRGSNGHEKEYVARVDKEITGDFLKRMAEGIYLKELNVKTRPCKIEKTGKFTFKITLTQGLNRQIRRMCEACGYHIRYLKRIRIAGVELGTLKSGEYRELTKEEIERLYAD